MRHQHRDLSILDFPTAYGRWIPDTSTAALAKINAWREARALSEVDRFQIWLQMAHRGLALVIAVGVIATCQRAFALSIRSARAPALRRLSLCWVTGVFVQVSLGAWTIWSNKAADIATAHVAVGAVMLSLGIGVVSFCSRASSATSPARLVMQDAVVAA
jgi:cytochrome c oxidase assembly protein subunit 15